MMIALALAVLTVSVITGAGVALYHITLALKDLNREEIPDRSGWIYFIGMKTPPENDDGPIKVGMSARNPGKERLPELRTMSPYPLRIIYKFYTEDRFEYERKIHKILEPQRQHGEWFDRDATLALIDELRGNQ